MAKIPIKFNRVAAAFDEAVKWRGPCDSSSGSEYWPESGASLSGLVNSFIEKGDGRYPFDMDLDLDLDPDLEKNDDISDKDEGFESDINDNERKESLRELLLECESDNKKGFKQKILHEIENALKLFDGINFENSSSRSGVKRNVMSYLRDKGFDAGLCKSRWEKTGRFPAGTYEYIDVNIGKTRYIIEVYMSEELDIVRPTTRYTALLDMIPSIIIVDKHQLLKKIIRLMSAAMKDSLKHSDMYVAPWRRNGYIQARYFSPYKRTINREAISNSAKLVDEKRLSMVGFEAELSSRLPYYCRDDGFASKSNGIRVGLLGAILQGK